MGWLARGAAAGRLVAARGDTWLPGALGALAFFGWLPFVLVVVPFPSAADLAFYGAGFFGVPGLIRAGLISLAVFAGLLAAAALAALAEAVLLAWLPPAAPRAARAAVGRVAVELFGIQLLCAIPAAISVVIAAVVFASVAPAEFQAPDIRGSLAYRIGIAMAPYAALILLAVVAGQLVGGAAARRAAWHGFGSGAALHAGVGDLRRNAAGLVGVALLTLAAHAAYLTAVYLLLRVLWAPIGPAFSVGQPGAAGTPFLLVGFIAIWFCLVLGAGAVHAWSSAWWSAELAAGSATEAEASREEGAPSARRT